MDLSEDKHLGPYRKSRYYVCERNHDAATVSATDRVPSSSEERDRVRRSPADEKL
jgi:hypothetical protein